MGKRRFERMAASCGSQRQRAGPTAMRGMAILHTLLEHIYDSRCKERTHGSFKHTPSTSKDNHPAGETSDCAQRNASNRVMAP
jgi:hypothetical protein